MTTVAAAPAPTSHQALSVPKLSTVAATVNTPAGTDCHTTCRNRSGVIAIVYPRPAYAKRPATSQLPGTVLDVLEVAYEQYGNVPTDFPPEEKR